MIFLIFLNVMRKIGVLKEFDKIASRKRIDTRCLEKCVSVDDGSLLREINLPATHADADYYR